MSMKHGKLSGFVFCLLIIIAIGSSIPGTVILADSEKALSDSFADDFDKGMDTAIWQKSDGWTNGSMFNCGWLGDHVTFNNGVMQLNLDKTASSGRPYTSAEYRTLGFYQYGTYEVRMKAAKQQGIVSSFFTYTGPSDNQPWDEIDIEILGRDTTRMQTNYFTNGQGRHETMIKLGFDASADFHVYKIVWAPKRIEWYVDGNLVNKAVGNIPTHPQKIMMNLWPGINVDDWLGYFSYKNPLVAEYDWVHYTKAE